MNNTAIVIQVNKIEPIEGMDRIQLVKLFGTQVIVGKDINVGDVLVYVDSNMKMSHDFLYHNNLYRHPELNKDKDHTGYFDDNGRVKCIKMRGIISDGFLFPIQYLSYLDAKDGELKPGDEFDSVNGYKFCEKYVPKVNRSNNGSGKNTGRKAPLSPMFVEHFDTDQFMRNKHKIPAGTVCYLEEKVHGTSHRTGNVKVIIEHPINSIKRFIWNLFGKSKLDNTSTVWQYMYLNGTRRVVHMPNVESNPYHDNTMREEVLEHLKKQKLFKGEQLYMELFGYEKTGKCIQKDFPYGCDEHLPGSSKGEYRTLLYRVTMNNEDGKVVDYSREYVYNRAEELGLEKPHLFEKVYFSGTERSMEILEEKIIRYAQGQSEMGKGAEDTLKEGVVVWFINDKGQWEVLKYKSDAFRAKESGNKDKGIIDQEDLN